MKLGTWISLGALGVATVMAGCVTEAESLFTDRPNTTDTGGSGGSGQGSSGQGGSGQGGSTTSSSSSSSSSGPGSSSSGTMSSSSSSTGSSSSSTGSSSSSGGPTDVVVFCADNQCNPKEVCCYHQTMPGLDHCSADPNCGTGYSVLSCNGPSDCPGALCCATRMNQVYTDVSCQATCDGFGQYIMCEGDQSVCPMGLTCQQSMSLGTGYMLCR